MKYLRRFNEEKLPDGFILDTLKKKLDKHIEEENYEEAAEIRDLMKQLISDNEEYKKKYGLDEYWFKNILESKEFNIDNDYVWGRIKNTDDSIKILDWNSKGITKGGTIKALKEIRNKYDKKIIAVDCGYPHEQSYKYWQEMYNRGLIDGFKDDNGIYIGESFEYSDLQSILDKWSINFSIKDIKDMWSLPHRHYHDLSHLDDMINQINDLGIKGEDYEKLIIAALFHDIIYDPKKNDNEEMSAKFLLSVCDNVNKGIKEIEQIILDTKTHESNTKLSEIFNKIDMSVVERDFEGLLEWEKGVWNEYKSYGPELYKKGRLQFLESLVDEYPNNKENLLKLIDWVKNNY